MPWEFGSAATRPSERWGRDERGINGTRMVLDAVSKAIIEQLQQDGRRPYASIAAAVGLSEAAVRQRVQRLVRSGVLQIVAVTDAADLIAELDEVDYVVVTAGSFDILAEVVCEDDDHLLHLLNERIRTIAGVRSTESFMYLKLSKQTYTWGTR